MNTEQDFSSGSPGDERSFWHQFSSTIVSTFGFSTVEEWFAADEFEGRILKGFLLILIINLFLVFMSWKIYGPRIVDRFMKPVPSALIEDLKQGATELKLPREHSPRI